MEGLFQPVTVHFQKGLGQKFRQPSGSGIDLSVIEEMELLKECGMDVYHLSVKVEAFPVNQNGSGGNPPPGTKDSHQPSGSGIDFSMIEEMELLKECGSGGNPTLGTTDSHQPSGSGIDLSMIEEMELLKLNEYGSDGNPTPGTTDSQITHAVFEKDKGEYQLRVVKQSLWVNGMRNDELLEIFESEKCVICLSKPPDTTALPCGHMSMCSDCAKCLRFETNLCPLCRQQMQSLRQMKDNGPDE